MLNYQRVYSFCHSTCGETSGMRSMIRWVRWLSSWSEFSQTSNRFNLFQVSQTWKESEDVSSSPKSERRDVCFLALWWEWAPPLKVEPQNGDCQSGRKLVFEEWASAITMVFSSLGHRAREALRISGYEFMCSSASCRVGRDTPTRTRTWG